MINNPLLDNDFLKKLYSAKKKKVFARLVALDFQENPIEKIEGRVTGGNISIDGTSAVRRTCTISLVTDELDINSYYWGLRSKFKVEIGLENIIDLEQYPETIWFPQGIFIITTFNTSQTTNNFTVSISGKDKMCMLNGDLSGSLTASIDFGVEEFYDKENNITTYTSVPIKKIIREGVHTYGGEAYHNIVINDLDKVGLELLEYRGDTPLFLLRDVERNQYVNYTTNGNHSCTDAKTNTALTLGTIPVYDTRVELSDSTISPTQVKLQNDRDGLTYTVAKVEYGQTAGYRITDLVYAGDLISNIGESFTSILDKIVAMLGNYEYFYDLDGRFVFQEKRTHIQTTWNNIEFTDSDSYAENSVYVSSNLYSFEGNELITSFQNNPNIANLKNDYSIWGERKLISGVKLPIHYRYAIDRKPIKYTTVSITESDISAHNSKYPNASLKPQKSQEIVASKNKGGWREVLYQMTLDYYAYNQLDNFLSKVAEANSEYPTGVTGYEQYYLDLQGFWRDLYNPNPSEEEQENYDEDGWNVLINKDPSRLNFWFDFLDTTGELDQFSVKVIGDRTKAVNDKTVQSIYFKITPNLIFTTQEEYIQEDMGRMSGYIPVFMQSNMESLFTISAQGKSAQDKLDELLYNHSYCIENITMSAIPIYHLQPNTRIYVHDEKSKIDGEYLVSRITLPLNYNGTMSITATKAPVRII